MIRPFVDALVRLAKESSQGAILASEKTVSDWLRRAGSSADAKRTALDALDSALVEKITADPSIAEFPGSVRDYIVQQRSELPAL